MNKVFDAAFDCGVKSQDTYSTYSNYDNVDKIVKIFDNVIAK